MYFDGPNDMLKTYRFLGKVGPWSVLCCVILGKRPAQARFPQAYVQAILLERLRRIKRIKKENLRYCLGSFCPFDPQTSAHFKETNLNPQFWNAIETKKTNSFRNFSHQNYEVDSNSYFLFLFLICWVYIEVLADEFKPINGSFFPFDPTIFSSF